MPGPLSKVVHGINSNLIRHILTKVLMLKCLVSGVDFFFFGSEAGPGGASKVGGLETQDPGKRANGSEPCLLESCEGGPESGNVGA